MKRFLGILVAAMFLASVGYVGAAEKKSESKPEATTEKEKTDKAPAKAKTTKGAKDSKEPKEVKEKDKK